MAGRKHHFIPQLYLRGFLAPGGGERVWQYRRASEAPFLSPIKDVGAQRDFYGAPNAAGVAPVDDAITAYENEIAEHVRYLRSLPDGRVENSDALAAALVHLIVRSRHVRETMKDFIGQMLESLRSITADSQVLRSWLGIDGDSFHPDLERQLEMTLILSGAEARLGLRRETLKRYTRYMIRERFDLFHPPELRKLAPQLEELGGKLNQTADETHLKILAESLSPEQRVEVLAALQWTIRSTAGPLVLPDCMGMSVSSTGVWRPALFVEQTDQVGFVMPLDRNRCLVGLADGNAAIDLAPYNEHAAACSSEFFVSSENEPSLVALIGQIGVVVNTQIEETISNASAEALADLDLHVLPDSDSGSLQRQKSTSEDPINFYFEGIGSQEDAQAIADTAAALIRYYSQDHPIGFLHGVTFAADLRVAADNLAKEFGGHPVYPSSSDLFSSVATYQTVPGDLHNLFRPIILLDYGYGLLADEDAYRHASASILYGSLAAASLMQIRYEAVEDRLKETPETALQFRLLEDGADGFSTYYTTRLSAFLIKDPLGSFEDELITMLERASVGLVWAYERHTDDGLVDTVYGPVRAIATSVLLTAARIAARLDAVDPNIETPAVLKDRLRPYGLDTWFELFRRDLAKTYARLPTHAEKDVFVTVPHFERLLWAMGVVPEAMDDGRLWINFRMLPSFGN
tara:strand:- start:63780 stop:65846 length:2067 start_codon:yes stop_codon:yes gene_type:complete